MVNEAIVVIFRSAIAFLLLFLFARILGKRQVTQLTFFEYVTGITIGSIASEMSVDLTTRPLPYAVGLAMWFLLTLGMQIAGLKVRWFGKLADGEPVVVIENGRLLDYNMHLARFRVDELMEQLRIHQVFDIGQVEFALLETNGKLSVQLKSQYAPVTPLDLGIPTQYTGLATELIVDGRIQDQNLDQVHVTREWLLGELRARNINDPKKVFFAVLNTKGDLFVDLYKDRGKQSANVSDYPGVQ